MNLENFFKKREKPANSNTSVALANNPNPSSEPSSKPSAPIQKRNVETDSLAFGELCGVFEKIEATTKRLAINEILVEFFSKLMTEYPHDLIYTVYLCLCRLGPAYEGLELGLGEALLVKAIGNATGRSIALIKSELEEKGDIGLVAQASRSNQLTMFKPKKLTVTGIFKVLKEIATATGQNAVNKKIEKIRHLLAACEGSESKFLFRMLAGKLRIGLAEKSILIALAHVSAKLKGSEISEDEADDLPAVIMKSVFNSLPNYEIILPKLLEFGIYELPKHCSMMPGIPVKPMLAHPTKSLAQVLDRFENLSFTCEYKYDGERAQIHRTSSGECFIYSRNSENMSQKYPDILKKLPLIMKSDAHSFVIDCEVVAFEPKEQKILPFQILSTRKRKDVTVDSVQVQVVLFAFDILYLNGESLLKKSLRDRRNALMDNFSEVPGEFYFAKHLDTSSVDDIQAFLDEAVQNSCEGLMIKTLDQDSGYEPARRSRNWLKVKKDYLDNIGDSLDLVVMGAYIGRGKRTGVYGGYLLGCYEPENEEYQAVCKLGTGFSDSMLETLPNLLKPHIIPTPRSYYRLTDSIKPDVWFEPGCVWEVKAADFSISPVYTAAWGLVDPNKGISLRFPRFVRDRTGEKGPEEASTSSQIAEMYRQQAAIVNQSAFDEEDYY